MDEWGRKRESCNKDHRCIQQWGRAGKDSGEIHGMVGFGVLMKYFMGQADELN